MLKVYKYILNDAEKGQSNPPPLSPLASSSALLGDPHLHPGHCISLPALNSPIHHECAQASASMYFLPRDILQQGVPPRAACKNTLLWFAVSWRVCACLKHSVSVCRRGL